MCWENVFENTFLQMNHSQLWLKHWSTTIIFTWFQSHEKFHSFQFHSILSRFCTLKRISNANLQLTWLFIIMIWRLQIFLETRTKIYIYCLAAPRPTLGHYRGDNLTLPMLITALDQFSIRRSPGALQRGWVPMPCPAPSEV